MSRRSKYPEQFRRDAIELVNSSDRPLRQIARELGVNHETLRAWVNVAKQAAETGPPAEDPAEAQELQRLRKRVAEPVPSLPGPVYLHLDGRVPG